MSPTALRWSAIPIGLLAFVLQVTRTFWWQPISWRFSFGIGLLVWMAGLLIVAGIPFGILAVVNSFARRRPARFVRGEDGGFTVIASPTSAATSAILAMLLSGGAVVTERVPGGDSMRLALIDFAWAVSIIVVGIFWAVALAILVVNSPQLHLDADGMTIRRLRRRVRLAWDELAPGGPPPPTKPRRNHMTVYRKAPLVDGRYAPSEDIPIGWLHIDPTVLANAIRYYVEHPEGRVAIGTAEELARLDRMARPASSTQAGTTSNPSRTP